MRSVSVLDKKVEKKNQKEKLVYWKWGEKIEV